MNEFIFNSPTQDELLKQLADRTQQSKIEPLSAKEKIDEAVLPPQMQGQAQMPNAFQRRLAEEIVGQKSLYGAAPEGAQGDIQRQMANAGANFARSVAEAAGLDMSGYGSDVTLADATKNLASQRAIDILGALNGEYSRSSDQYFEDEYRKGIMLGLSARRAEKLAGNMARDYQANRVAYLNNVYNSYGRDGLVTNEFGNQFIAALATENPMLANYYAQIYPNAKDAYKRENELENKAIDQNNLFAKMVKAFNLNEASADNAFARSELAKENDLPRRLKEYAEKDKINLQTWKEKQAELDGLRKSQPDEVDKLISQGYKLGKAYGLDDEKAYAFGVEHAFNNLVGGKSQSKGSSQEPKLTEKQQEQYNTVKNLINTAHDTHSDDDITALEDFINEHGQTFAPEYYQMFKDTLLALKGYQYKLRADDNNAAALWSQIRDVDVLEQMYPKENWDEYWKLKGGKPK